MINNWQEVKVWGYSYECPETGREGVQAFIGAMDPQGS